MSRLSSRWAAARDVAIVVIGALLALLFAAGGAQGSDDLTRDQRIGFVFAGVAALATAFNYAVVRLYRPRPPVDLTVEDGAPAIVVQLSRAMPLGAAVASAGWALLAGVLAAVVDPLAGALAAGALAAFCLFATVNAVRALLRRPRLVLRRDRVSLSGWYDDTAVDWLDVAWIGFVPTSPYLTVIRVHSVVGAASYTWARHHIGLRRRPPRDPVLDVAVRAVAEPVRLLVFLERMAAVDDAGRSAMVEPTAVAFLDGSMTDADQVHGIVEL